MDDQHDIGRDDDVEPAPAEGGASQPTTADGPTGSAPATSAAAGVGRAEPIGPQAALDARARAASAGARRAVAARLRSPGLGGVAAVTSREATSRRRVAITAVAAVVVLVLAALFITRLGHSDVSTTSPQGLPYLVPSKLPEGFTLQSAGVASAVTGQVGVSTTHDVQVAAELVCGQLNTADPVAHPIVVLSSEARTRFAPSWVQEVKAAAGDQVSINGAPGKLSHSSASALSSTGIPTLVWMPSEAVLVTAASRHMSDDVLLRTAEAVSADEAGHLQERASVLPAGISCATVPVSAAPTWSVSYRGDGSPPRPRSTAGSTDVVQAAAPNISVAVRRGDRWSLLWNRFYEAASRGVTVAGRQAWLGAGAIWSVTVGTNMKGYTPSNGAGGSTDTSEAAAGGLPDLASDQWVARTVSWLQDGHQVSVSASGLTEAQLLAVAGSLKAVSSSGAKKLEEQAPEPTLHVPKTVVIATDPTSPPSWRVTVSLRDGKVADVQVQRASGSETTPTTTPPGCRGVGPINLQAATLLGSGMNTCATPPILVAAVSKEAGAVEVTLPSGTMLRPELKAVPGDSSVRVAVAVLPKGTTSARLVVKGHDGTVRVSTTVAN